MAQNWTHMGELDALSSYEKDEPDKCLTCVKTISVKHILIYIWSYADIITKLNSPKNQHAALGSDHVVAKCG